MRGFRLALIFFLLVPMLFALSQPQNSNATLSQARLPVSFQPFYANPQWLAQTGGSELGTLRIHSTNAQHSLNALKIGEMDELAAEDFLQMLSAQEAKDYAQAATHLQLAAQHRKNALANATIAASLWEHATDAGLGVDSLAADALLYAPSIVATQGAIAQLHFAYLAQRALDYIVFALSYGPYFESSSSEYLLAFSHADSAVNAAAMQAEKAAGGLEFSGMCDSTFPPPACAGWRNFVFEASLQQCPQQQEATSAGAYACARIAALSLNDPPTFTSPQALASLRMHEKYNSLVGKPQWVQQGTQQQSLLVGLLMLARESTAALSLAQDGHATASQTHKSVLAQAQDALERAQAQQYWKLGIASGFEDTNSQPELSDALSFYERFEHSKSLVQQSSTQLSLAQSSYSSASRGYLLFSTDAHASGIAQAQAALEILGELEEDSLALLQKASSLCTKRLLDAQLKLQLSPPSAASRASLAAAKIEKAQEQLSLAPSKNSGSAYEAYLLACENAQAAIALLESQVTDDGSLQEAEKMLAGAKKDGLEISYEQYLFSSAKIALTSEWAGKDAHIGAVGLLQSIRDSLLEKESAALEQWQQRYERLLAFEDDAQLSSEISSFSSQYVRDGKISSALALGELDNISFGILRLEEAAQGRTLSIASLQLSQNAQLEILRSSFWPTKEGTVFGIIRTSSGQLNATHVPISIPCGFELRMQDLQGVPQWLESISYNPQSRILQLQISNATAGTQYEAYFERSLPAPPALIVSSLVRSTEGTSVRTLRTINFNAQLDAQGMLFYPLPQGAVLLSSTLNSNSLEGSIVAQNGTHFAAPASVPKGANTLEIYYMLENAFEASSTYSSASMGAKTSIAHTLSIYNVSDSLNGAQLFFGSPAGIFGFSATASRAGALMGASSLEGASGGYVLEIGNIMQGDSVQFFITYSIENSSYVEEFISMREKTAQALNDSAAQSYLFAARSKLDEGDAATALELASKVSFATAYAQEEYTSQIDSLGTSISSMEESLGTLSETPFWKENTLAEKISASRSLLHDPQLAPQTRLAKAKAMLLDAAGDVSALQQRLEKNATQYSSLESGPQALQLLHSARTSILFGDSALALLQCVRAALLLQQAQNEAAALQLQQAGNVTLLLLQAQEQDAQLDSLLEKYSAEYEDAKAARLGSVFSKTPTEIKAGLAQIAKQIAYLQKEDASASEFQKALDSKASLLLFIQDSLLRLSEQSNSSLLIAHSGVLELEEKAQSAQQKQRAAQLSSALLSASSLHAQGKYSQSIYASSQVAKSASAALGELPAGEDNTGIIVAAVSFIFAACAIAYLVFAGKKGGGMQMGPKSPLQKNSVPDAAAPDC